MDNSKIVVDISAKLHWQHPPKDTEEEIMRKSADIMVAAAGKKLELAVQLLVLELLNAQSFK